MTWKARNALAIAIGAIGLVSLAGLAAAQTGRWSGGGWYGDRTPVQDRLTQEQARKVEEIRAKYEEKLVPLEMGLASKRVELDAALASGEAEPAKVTALRHQVRDLEGQIEDVQMEANAAAVKFLTPEQRAYFGGTFDVFDGRDGWSCPMMDRGTSQAMAPRWRRMGWRGDWDRGMGWGCCW